MKLTLKPDDENEAMLLLAMLIVILICALSGCGGGDSDDSKPPQRPAPGVSYPQGAHLLGAIIYSTYPGGTTVEATNLGNGVSINVLSPAGNKTLEVQEIKWSRKNWARDPFTFTDGTPCSVNFFAEEQRVDIETPDNRLVFTLFITSNG